MNWLGILGGLAIGISALSLSPESAVGQKTSLKEQLLGSWTLVSHESVRRDGSRFSMYGVNPKGIAFFDAGGRFIITVMRLDRSKYAIDNPTQGAPEENNATAQGTITYFGTYSVREDDRSIAIH